MTTLNPKAPDAILAYELDYKAQLGEDVITSFVATVEAGTVVIETSSNGDDWVRLLISGGAADEDAEISVEITTEGEQVFTQTYTLAIRAAAQANVATTTTKPVAVEMCFEVMTLAGYEFDTSAEEMSSTLRSLDVMMAELEGPGRNLRMGYNAPAIIGQSDLEDPIGVPDWTLDFVATSLAMRRAPSIGKTMSAEARQSYTRSKDSVNAAFAKRVERPIPYNTPGYPRGRWGWWGAGVR